MAKVAAAVIGLIAAVTVTILETSVTDVYTALIALGAFAALNHWHGKLTVIYVMAVAGIVGAILQHTVVWTVVLAHQGFAQLLPGRPR